MEKKHKQDLLPGAHVELLITGLASDGRGLGRLESGCVVFAADALPGQQVQVVLDSVRPRFAEGTVQAVLAPAPAERPAPCPHAPVCGGCPWQKLPYATQLHWKQRIFYDALQRVGKQQVEEHPIIPSPDEWGYRNKMAFAFGRPLLASAPDSTPDSTPDRAPGLTLGQRGRRSHTVTDLRHCLLQDALTMEVLAMVRRIAQATEQTAMQTSGQTAEAARGVWRHAVVRRPRSGGLGLELIVSPAYAGPGGDTLYAALREALPELTAFALTSRAAASDVAVGETTLFAAGTPLSETLTRPDGSHLSLQFDHTAFLQVNTPAAERLYAEALAVLRPHGGERLWDVYCGVGSIGLFMAPSVGEVCGIENVPGAVAMARANAARCGAAARYETGDAALLASRARREAVFGRSADPSRDLVVVDPPRSGLDRATLDGLLAMRPHKILYVSCAPATLARDALRLATAYRLTLARPVDLFPQTPHVEGLTLWERNA